MNKTVYFPTYSVERLKLIYWEIHLLYYINLFKDAGYTVLFKPELNYLPGNLFEIEIDGNKCLIDYGDSSESNIPDIGNYKAVFKAHLTTESKGIYPMCPISFYDWNSYRKLKEEIRYDAKNEMIINNQKAYGNATERRIKVRNILSRAYGAWVDFEITDQVKWWKKFSTSLCYVHVPGFSQFMTDRGSLQALFFGMLVITPKLPEFFPYNKQLEEGVHYIKVREDFLDVVEKISWCQQNPDQCAIIAANAKKFCQENLMPYRVISWLEDCLKWG